MFTQASKFVAALAVALLYGTAQAQAEPDVKAAEALIKKSECSKCHAVSAKKDGPSFKSTAEKYRGKTDAESKLFTHLTTNPTIKIDGKEEKHVSPKTDDEAQVKNLVRYVLTR